MYTDGELDYDHRYEKRDMTRKSLISGQNKTAVTAMTGFAFFRIWQESEDDTQNEQVRREETRTVKQI